MATMTEDAIVHTYAVILGRSPSREELERLAARTDLDALKLLHAFMSSAEFTHRSLDHCLDIHLYLVHSARTKLVCTMLPKADFIVDIGGANGTLYDMGYPSHFKELTVIDLPDEKRCDIYRGLKLEALTLPFGKVNVLYANATDLSGIADQSTDLVWMGQVIEHVTEEESFAVYSEVKRILLPGGHFCLDTPNRNVTEIYSTGWIHPEHKIEYKPEHLRRNLLAAGFRIDSQLGLCQMTNTCRTKAFDYKDFVTGAGFSENLEGCFIQYFDCVV